MMIFQLRKEDGSVGPFSSGTFIAPEGSMRHLDRDAFRIVTQDTWHSPDTRAVYPARWTVTVFDLALTLQIEPHLADQELNVSHAYREGAVQIEGERAGRPVRGHGYVEMTGYAGSMQGQI